MRRIENPKNLIRVQACPQLKQKQMENLFWIEEQFLEVDKLLEKAQYAEAKKLLEQILEDEPGFGRAHNHLGWLYYAKLDDYEKAAYHFKLSIKFSANYPAPYLNYTYLLNYLNRHDDLVEHVASALKVEGVSQSIINNELGKSYEVNGNFKAAVNAYMEAKRFSLDKKETEMIDENLSRVKNKIGIFQKKLFLF